MFKKNEKVTKEDGERKTICFVSNERRCKEKEWKETNVDDDTQTEKMRKKEKKDKKKKNVKAGILKWTGEKEETRRRRGQGQTDLFINCKSWKGVDDDVYVEMGNEMKKKKS